MRVIRKPHQSRRTRAYIALYEVGEKERITGYIWLGLRAPAPGVKIKDAWPWDRLVVCHTHKYSITVANHQNGDWLVKNPDQFCPVCKKITSPDGLKLTAPTAPPENKKRNHEDG